MYLIWDILFFLFAFCYVFLHGLALMSHKVWIRIEYRKREQVAMKFPVGIVVRERWSHRSCIGQGAINVICATYEHYPYDDNEQNIWWWWRWWWWQWWCRYLCALCVLCYEIGSLNVYHIHTTDNIHCKLCSCVYVRGICSRHKPTSCVCVFFPIVFASWK